MRNHRQHTGLPSTKPSRAEPFVRHTPYAIRQTACIIRPPYRHLPLKHTADQSQAKPSRAEPAVYAMWALNGTLRRTLMPCRRTPPRQLRAAHETGTGPLHGTGTGPPHHGTGPPPHETGTGPPSHETGTGPLDRAAPGNHGEHCPLSAARRHLALPRRLAPPRRLARRCAAWRDGRLPLLQPSAGRPRRLGPTTPSPYSTTCSRRTATATATGSSRKS